MQFNEKVCIILSFWVNYLFIYFTHKNLPPKNKNSNQQSLLVSRPNLKKAEYDMFCIIHFFSFFFFFLPYDMTCLWEYFIFSLDTHPEKGVSYTLVLRPFISHEIMTKQATPGHETTYQSTITFEPVKM